MTDHCESPAVLNLPVDESLPFVTYGALRPGEPAYNQISRYVETVEDISIPGSLYVRDGLPLLKLATTQGCNKVPGYIINFRKRDHRKAYETICRFEPRGHYEWKMLPLERGSDANVLVGVLPDQGSESAEDLPWSSLRDPVFEHGLPFIRSVAKASAQSQFKPVPSDYFEWERFFRLQMAYLLLWSAVERFCSLAYGPARNPMSKLQKMAQDRRIAEVIRAQVVRSDEVLDVRDPTKRYYLDGAHPEECIFYYYQVRNNLSHRGKGAWRDGEKVRLALKELLEIFDAFLSSYRSDAQGQANARMP